MWSWLLSCILQFCSAYGNMYGVILPTCIAQAEWQIYCTMTSWNNYVNVNRCLIENWGSHGNESVDCGLLGRDIVYFCRLLPTFQRNISPPSSRKWYVPLKRWQPPIGLNDGTTQKTTIDKCQSSGQKNRVKVDSESERPRLCDGLRYTGRC
jgi:hypothetical protein